MFEKLENCPICNHTSFVNYKVCTDYNISQESFAIVSCKKCDFKFTNPRPTEQELYKYYESDNYISHSNSKKGLINITYQLVRNFTLKQKVNLINNLSEKSSILDFGCGTGEFLLQCKKDGWNITGVEPTTKARNQAEKNTNQTIVSSINDITNKDKFTIISLWHVLEHIPDLNSTVKLLRKRLKKDGYLITAVPNYRSYDADYYQHYWAGYDLPRHLYHFDQKSIKQLMKKHNLTLKKIIPMKFDAFYVSLLSEKYKKSSTPIKNAIQIGRISNQKAKKEKQNYSSLIYIFKHA